MGGRIDDFAVVESNPSTFYVGTASGGILKTTNNGTTFEPIFDDQLVSSIGDLAIAPSDPQVLYAGTGEPNNRQSSSWGNGVYKTLDGGKTWQHMGLAETHHIGRVLGAPEPSGGGLRRGARAPVGPEPGARALQDDGRRPQLDQHEVRRPGHRLRGRGDGPAEPGHAVRGLVPAPPDAVRLQRRRARQRPVEDDRRRRDLDEAHEGAARGRDRTHRDRGLPARSEDRLRARRAREGGRHLPLRGPGRELRRKMSATNPRPSYYSKLRIDPNNDQRIWVLGAPMYTSEDGGKTFKTDVVDKIHGDYHAMWIDPANSDHMIVGSDGGIHLSYDRGRSWDFVNTVPARAVLRGGARQPAPVPRLRRPAGQRQLVGALAHPLPAGDLERRVDPGRGRRRLLLRARPDGPRRRLHGEPGRQRPAPAPRDRPAPRRSARSRPRARSTASTGTRRSWSRPTTRRRSTTAATSSSARSDRGDTWTLVSPDLTTSDDVKRDATPIFGKTAKELLSRNDGVVHFGTITTLAESPLRAGVLWAGTDDGNLQVSRDGGATWTNVAARVPGVPKGTYVSRVEASRTGEGAAYVGLRRPPLERLRRLPLLHLGLRPDVEERLRQPSRGRHPQRRARAPEERRRAVRRHRARACG